VSPVRYELDFYIPEDDIFHNHRRENLKSHSVQLCDSSRPAVFDTSVHAARKPVHDLLKYEDIPLNVETSFTVPELCGELLEEPYPSSRTMFCCCRQDVTAVVEMTASPAGSLSGPTPLQACRCCCVVG
jgi:hypothetical protein